MHARATEKPRQAYRRDESVPRTDAVTDMSLSCAGRTNPLTHLPSCLPSRAQVIRLMIVSPVFSHILLVFSFFCTAAASEPSEKSLYDKSTAQKLDFTKLSFFGP